jgi:mono/diheme cytochrome c family protein
MSIARTRNALIAGAVTALLMTPAQSVAAADAERGHRIAKSWCTSCHVIDKAGTGTRIDTAPSFPSIAADAGRSDERRLAAWLSTSHPTMPDFSLANDEIADLVAYIRTLGAR